MDALTGEHTGTPSTGRMNSLDVFRGLTIAGMILVNNPGTWDAIYSPLEHSKWHGWTPTDPVFPFFLFILRVSHTPPLSRPAEAGRSRPDLYVKIVRRALIIFALGLLLSDFPYKDPATFRIPGVLQRIAVCYLLPSVIFLNTKWRTQAALAALLLLAYWAILMFVPAPGFHAGDLSMKGSIASYVDRTVFGKHTWKPLYDPEGILSTTGALATTLAGVLAGHYLRTRRSALEKVAAMFTVGAACIIVGWAWNYWLPINKALWTSSYVVFTSGLALELKTTYELVQ